MSLQPRDGWPAWIFAFDLLARGDDDLRPRPLLERKDELAVLLTGAGRVIYAQHVEGKGLELYGLTEAQGLEGIVGKPEESRYIAGRSSNWIKVKTPAGREREATRFEKLRT